MAALPLEFVEGILSQLDSSNVPFLQFICCFNDEKTKLKSRLTAVRSRLLDVEEQQDQTHTEKDWLEKLQLILYEADDLVEEIRLYETADVERRNVLCRFFKTTIPFHIRMPLKLKAIRERLVDFTSERDEVLKLKAIRERLVDFTSERDEVLQPPQRLIDGGYRNGNEETRMEPLSYIPSAYIIGREKDKEAIKNMLKESSMSSDGSNVPISIAIIGMGGLGKTILARSVYEDAEGFDLKMWVWVSQDFDVKRLVKRVIEAATRKECEITGMTQLEYKLRECLDGKKYLLVLDDIWNNSAVSWYQFENLLKGGAKGSVILATTREMNVASTMNADQYPLKDLDEDDCWSLFKQQLRFKIDKMEEEKQKFVDIGREILKKCGGIPLAIVTVGGLLRCLDPEEWQNVQNDRLWSQAQEENHILPSLKVSYARLPSTLKKCFAYCSLFPRGDKIEKTKLTQLWIAQGFIDQHSNDELLADSANMCFDELRNRSFFQDEEEDEYGDVMSCKMNNLMYDLAREVAGSECVIVNHDGVLDISERIIHASVNNGILCTKARNLRTLLTSGISNHSERDSYTTFRCLRVLELYVSGSNPNVLNSLRKLVHLRYLDLSRSEIRMLPNSIFKLQYLQTLKLNNCTKFEELPGNIKKLASLIHLENKGCDRLKGMPLGIDQLTSIQNLSVFVLGGKGWAGLSELEGLNNLRGDLSIKILRNARNAISESRKAFCLKDKIHLQTLSLHWEMREDEDRDEDEDKDEDRDENRDEDVALLESLQPNPHLKRLEIGGYGGVKFPSWMGKSLPNLVKIHLLNCPSCECFPLFVDQLPFLKYLFLQKLPKLEYIRSYVSDSSLPPTSSSSPSNSNILSGAVGFFPALKNVTLDDLPKLKEWSIELIVGDDGGKPKTDSAAATQPKRLLSLYNLSTLDIIKCPELTSMPSFPNIEELILNDFSGALIQSMTMAETICPTTSSLPSFLTLSKLKSLRIMLCKDLVFLPQGWLENLASLDRLTIRDCAQLESLSRETTHMPKDLKDKPLDFPKEDDLQSCRKLRSLKLEKLPKLTSLPKWLQHATNIKIDSCNGLVLRLRGVQKPTQSA